MSLSLDMGALGLTWGRGRVMGQGEEVGVVFLHLRLDGRLIYVRFIWGLLERGFVMIS